eukprot:10150268-Lingulodinium_polyedra.AAC.1
MSSINPVAGQSTVIVYYDEQSASEAQNQLSARECLARFHQIDMCIASKLGVDGDRILPGVLHIMPDHGKTANATIFKQ